MASVQLDPPFGDSASRRPLIPAIRWGAVIAGVAVGISIQLALTLLGVATGLSATDVATTEGSTIGRGALMWAGISMLIAALVGGFVAARMSGLKRKADGVLHGVVAWSVTTLLFASLATTATGTMLGTMFSAINPNQVVSTVTSGNAGAAASRMADAIRTQTGINVTQENMQNLQGYVAAGQRDQAVQYMVSAMGMDQGKAATIVDQTLIVSGSPQQASPAGQDQANRALDRAGLAAWTVFGSVALSLLLGIIGGLFGAVSSRRTTWSDADGPLVTASSSRPAGMAPAATAPGMARDPLVRSHLERDPSDRDSLREHVARDPLARDPLARDSLDPLARDPLTRDPEYRDTGPRDPLHRGP